MSEPAKTKSSVGPPGVKPHGWEVIQVKTTDAEASRSFDLIPSWAEVARRGMGSAQRRADEDPPLNIVQSLLSEDDKPSSLFGRDRTMLATI